MSDTLMCIFLLRKLQGFLQAITEKCKLNLVHYPPTLGLCRRALGIRLPYFGLPQAMLCHNCWSGLNSENEVYADKVTFHISQPLMDNFRRNLNLFSRINEYLSPVSKEGQIPLSLILFLYFSLSVIFLRFRYLSGKAISTTDFTGICECASFMA